MNAPNTKPVVMHADRSPNRLATRLAREQSGEVLFDRASRGRYSTDASIYQIEPVGVLVPRTEDDARIGLQIAAEEGTAVLQRGGGTSQCGQTVGAALVIDNSKYLNNIVEFLPGENAVIVQPGVVLDQLNAFLRPHGLWHPVDVSTGAQATIGGMAGNNSCGSRSIVYGNMVHNVLGIDAILADGSKAYFGPTPADCTHLSGPERYRQIVRRVREIAAREALEIEARFPKLLRRVGGYNLETVRSGGHNMAQLLVGSEGTLAYFRRLKLKLSPIPPHTTLGVCHFPTFYQAMALTQRIVSLGPSAVELVDSTMIDLARSNPFFRRTVDRFLQGEPDAILLVEFAGEDRAEQIAKLKSLTALMGDLGLPASVVEIEDAALQKAVWEVRKAGLNIMMSMKGDGKPVSFIEDCAVPLEHLAEYTDRLTRVFEKHGTRGTWYAHASVGTLHVRPILNMKEDGHKKMRAIAEEAAAMVREYKGAYSGEHGDGLVRSEWIEPMFGAKLTRAFEEIKDLIDPQGIMNPGKIVRPSNMDDRTLFRYKPGYRAEQIETVLDWTSWRGADNPTANGFAAAVEMCNNNGHCRKFDAEVMCPSYRITRDEQHLTRGRANTLRLAISGQLGPDAMTSPELYATMDLCVSCKGCKRECPTGIDMAKMKIEFLHQYHKVHPRKWGDMLVAYLPRYAPIAARLPWLMNLRDAIPGAARLSEKLLGLSARRTLPRWRTDTFLRAPNRTAAAGISDSREVVFFVDTFNNYFEPENAHAARAVLHAAGYTVHIARARDSSRPLCCGRTFLAAGMVDEARHEARRMVEALSPYVARGIAVVGLEPACLLTLRDELTAMFPGEAARQIGESALLLEEFLLREKDAGRLQLKLKSLGQRQALLHGHCHQKAFNALRPALDVLGWIPDLTVDLVKSSCCGMAGSFGYDAEHYETSLKMGELELLPKVRAAAADTLVIADGTSCRHQIHDGAGREAMHVAQVLAQALA